MPMAQPTLYVSGPVDVVGRKGLVPDGDNADEPNSSTHLYRKGISKVQRNAKRRR